VGAVLSGADVEGVAVRVCAGDDVGAAAGAAHPGGPGLRYLAAGRGRTTGAECVSAAARAWIERRVTQVLEMARQMKLGRLGRWRSTRRGFMRRRRGTGWRRKSDCGRSERDCGGAFGSAETMR